MSEQPVAAAAVDARMLIDGQLREASGGATYEVINPATAEVAGLACDGSAEDVHAAIAGARHAFDHTDWANDPHLRRATLLQLRDALVAEQARLRELIVTESGSPIMLTRGVQLETPIADLEFWADMALNYQYETSLPELHRGRTVTNRVVRREPVGVVAAITPWNFPFYLNMSKLAPALAAGCTVVLKPAPDTPWSATEIGRIAHTSTDLPAGVLNVVTGADPMLGEVLTTSPDVDLITFTGSTATGRRVMRSAADSIKRVCLELGGKSAAIVLDDADLAEAVRACAKAVCVHAGQSCSLATRLLVPSARYAEAVEIAKQAMEAMTPADPTEPKTMMGPLISAVQRERVLSYITSARRNARVVTGGGIPASPARGFYIEPTLIADADPDSAIAQEEVFGPVLVMIGYDDDDDAVRIANNSSYGLGGTIWSADTQRALNVARRVRTGTLSINGAIWLAPDTPVGGYKQSGLGREHGIAGFEEFLEIKSIGLPASTADSTTA
ncbi:Betaine-aldehyde dehydrogenase [Mycolicibacterium rhodesiae JS60]|nr:Betaine-aldehyde dehydrogenase [Mycolicibacterium rhodesiae JS60]